MSRIPDSCRIFPRALISHNCAHDGAAIALCSRSYMAVSVLEKF